MLLTEKKKGYAAAVLYSCIIGFSFLAVKTTLANTSIPILLAHRFTLAFFAAVIAACVRKIDVRINVKDFKSILPLAVFYPILYFGLQSMGLQYTSSSSAGILQATAPVFSAILAVLVLKERTNGVQLTGIVLTIAGVALLSLRNSGSGAGENALYGSVLLLISAFASGVYNVLSRKLSRKYTTFILTFWMLAIGFVWFLMYSFLSLPQEGGWEQFVSPLSQPGYIIAILYLGVLSSMGSAYLSNYALARMEAAKMSVFSSLATVISVAVGVLVLHEPFHLVLLAGMCIIVFGVLLVVNKK